MDGPHKITLNTGGMLLVDGAVELDDIPLRHVKSILIQADSEDMNRVIIEMYADVRADILAGLKVMQEAKTGKRPKEIKLVEQADGFLEVVPVEVDDDFDFKKYSGEE